MKLCNTYFVKKIVYLNKNTSNFNDKLLQKNNKIYLDMKNIIYEKFSEPIRLLQKYLTLTDSDTDLEPVPPNKYALLIGINYKNTRYQLNGCINDATNLNTFLINNGYLEENITLLTDETNIKPTYNNIINQLKKIISNEQSMFFLLYQYKVNYIKMFCKPQYYPK